MNSMEAERAWDDLDLFLRAERKPVASNEPRRVVCHITADKNTGEIHISEFIPATPPTA